PPDAAPDPGDAPDAGRVTLKNWKTDTSPPSLQSWRFSHDGFSESSSSTLMLTGGSRPVFVIDVT
ncbi:MAG: hypothetical protein PVG57_08300, partial [Gammaproteobacteria bacterium]